MVFEQSFKYSKNEKINIIKVILRLKYLFYQNIYVLFYICNAISTQTNPKKGLTEKKNTPIALTEIKHGLICFVRVPDESK